MRRIVGAIVEIYHIAALLLNPVCFIIIVWRLLVGQTIWLIINLVQIASGLVKRVLLLQSGIQRGP